MMLCDETSRRLYHAQRVKLLYNHGRACAKEREPCRSVTGREAKCLSFKIKKYCADISICAIIYRRHAKKTHNYTP